MALGSVYSGKGQPDAQSNQVAGGAAGATGNAAAWFPGNARVAEHEGHQHPHTLSGYKSQSLVSSSLGSG